MSQSKFLDLELIRPRLLASTSKQQQQQPLSGSPPSTSRTPDMEPGNPAAATAAATVDVAHYNWLKLELARKTIAAEAAADKVATLLAENRQLQDRVQELEAEVVELQDASRSAKAWEAGMELLLRKFREGLTTPPGQQQQQQQQQQQRALSPHTGQPSDTPHKTLDLGTLPQKTAPTGFTDGGASTYSNASTATAPSFITAAGAAAAAAGQERGHLGGSQSGGSNASIASAAAGCRGQEWLLAAAYSDNVDGDSQDGSWGGANMQAPNAWEVYRCMQNSSAGGIDATVPGTTPPSAAAAAAGGTRNPIHNSSPRVSSASLATAATTGSTAAEVAAMARAGRLALERITAAVAAAEKQAARPWRQQQQQQQQQQQRYAVKSRRPQLRSSTTKAGAGYGSSRLE